MIRHRRQRLPQRIEHALEGGDRRSIGRANEVADRVLEDPSLFGALFEVMHIADPIISMRAADALEKVTRTHPTWLQPFKAKLLKLATTSGQSEVRWHLAQMLPRLQLTRHERAAALAVLKGYLQDHSAIVKTCALQGLTELVADQPWLRPQVTDILQTAIATGTPAMRARGRKLLARWRIRQT